MIWIDVKERLPTPALWFRDAYVVYWNIPQKKYRGLEGIQCGNGIAKFETKKKKWIFFVLNMEGRLIPSKYVTHWMPLPEPPEAQ